MTGLDHLKMLAQGTRPQDDGLLGNTNVTWGHETSLGEESILAKFTAAPFTVDDELLGVETPMAAALIGTNSALVADLYGGRIGRLWRVGGEVNSEAGQIVDVAFDTDMRQERGNLNFRFQDHPSLAPEASDKLLAASAALIEQVRQNGNLRARGFIIRAFGDTHASVALMSIFTLGNQSCHSASFDYAVIGIQPDGEVRNICARSNPRDWTPRL